MCPASQEGDNEPPATRLKRQQILTRGVGCIRHHHDFATPWRQDQLVGHLAKESLLGLIALTALTPYQAKGQRDAIDIPLGQQHHRVQPKGVRSILVEPPALGPRIFLRAPALDGSGVV